MKSEKISIKKNFKVKNSNKKWWLNMIGKKTKGWWNCKTKNQF